MLYNLITGSILAGFSINGVKKMIKEKNVYKRMGYLDRKDYLISLSNEYDIKTNDVFALSSILGPNEDFDGLIVALEDYDQTLGGLWV